MTASSGVQFSGPRKAVPDVELEPILEESRRSSGLGGMHSVSKMSDQDIIEFIFFPVINEVTHTYSAGKI